MAEAVRRQFELIDTNNDGIILRAELAETLQLLDESLWSNENVDALLQAIDASGDGIIQYSESINYVFANTEGDEAALFFTVCEEALLRERKVRAKSREDRLLDVQVSMLSGSSILVEDLRHSTPTTTLYGSVAKLLKLHKDDFILHLNDSRIPPDGKTLGDIGVQSGAQLTATRKARAEASTPGIKQSNFTEEEIKNDRVEGTYDSWESDPDYAYSRPSHYRRAPSYDSFLSSF